MSMTPILRVLGWLESSPPPSVGEACGRLSGVILPLIPAGRVEWIQPARVRSTGARGYSQLHPAAKLLVHLAGTMRVATGNRLLRLRAGDTCIVRPGVAYREIVPSKTHAVNLILMPTPKGLYLHVGRIDSTAHARILLSATATSAQAFHAGRLIELLASLPDDTAAALSGHALATLLHLLPGAFSGAESERLSAPFAVVVARREIQARFADHSLTVVQIAEAVGMNPRSLVTIFRRATGQTVTGLLTRVRIEAAQALLLRKPSPVREIAREVGFTSESHFIAVFRRFTGSSPGRYRRHLNERLTGPGKDDEMP